MRRPVKPFVTEYKAPNRRSPLPAVPGTPLDAAPPRNGLDAPPAEGPSSSSYEAALRAADALFAPARAPVTPEPEAETEAQPHSEAEAETAAPRSGRILQAIEETPPPSLIEPEEEPAPKRRGRKPGSKNKPKVPAAVTLDEMDDEDDELVDWVFPETPAPAPVALPVYRPVAVRPRVAAPTTDEAVSPVISRNLNRYPWVRKKLGPGEQWKRRLPKVCW